MLVFGHEATDVRRSHRLSLAHIRCVPRTSGTRGRQLQPGAWVLLPLGLPASKPDAWVCQSVVTNSDAVIVREKPNLLPRAFPGRAETPTARGWVPERSAISGRMRPRGRFTPPGDSRPPPSLRVALAGDLREPGALGPRRWGGAPQHTVRAG